MNGFKRVLVGLLSVSLGLGAIWFAIASYRLSSDLTPLTGGLRGEDYAYFLALGGLGAALLAISYVLLFRQPRA